MGLLTARLVYARVVLNTKAKTLLPIIDELVRPGSLIISNEWCGYNNVKKKYAHEVVKHKIKQHVNKKGFHTNSIEGFWSQLKRGIFGVYHVVSKKHLPKYCKEFVFRYNTRKQTNGERFWEFLQSKTERLYMENYSWNQHWYEKNFEKQYISSLWYSFWEVCLFQSFSFTLYMN